MAARETGRGTLSRTAIVDAALRLVDAGGLEALSMRSLGRELGVQAMSLYNHVANKAEVIDALHERLVLEISFPELDADWVESLRMAAHAYRRVALNHPQGFVLLATRPLATPAEIAHVAPMLELLASSGFGLGQQLLIINIYFTALNGLLLAEVGPVPGHSDIPEPDAADVFRRSADADPRHSPTIAGLAALAEAGFSADSMGEQFALSVEVILTGLRSIVPDRTNEAAR